MNPPVTPNTDLIVYQITSVLPPAHDGVGDAACKIHRLLRQNGIASFIITSSDQREDSGVLRILSRWSWFAFVSLNGVIRPAHNARIVFHYPSPRYRRSISLMFLPLFFRLLGRETVVYLHELIVYSLPGKLKTLLMLLFSSKILTTDRPNYEFLRRFLFFKRSKLLPTGSNMPPRLHVREAPGHEQPTEQIRRKRQLLSFGHVMVGKGLENLLDAFDGGERLRDAYHLHVIGGLPEIPRPSDTDLLARIKGRDYCTYHGFLSGSEFLASIAEFDIIILPFPEGLSERRGSFMAGMASGKPILTTRPKFPIDGLEEKENILFVDDARSDTLANYLLSVMTIDDIALCRIGSAAREWYEENFSDEAFIEKFMEFIGN